MQQSTVDYWTGSDGDAYIERNRIEWDKRTRFWRGVIPDSVKTVLEVGCNIGSNLKAIRAAVGIDGVGVDLNEKALLECASAGFECHQMPAAEIGERFAPESFDLVFTAGVLIHIPPEDLDRVMAAIVQVSRRYVIAVEYAYPVEQMVEYRGQADKLWKRPFGSLYEAMGLKRHGFGFAAKLDGFDDCAWWRLSK